MRNMVKTVATSNDYFLSQWHIFIILIVSCTNVIVAPSKMSIITSIGMEVYNSVQRDCTCTS